MTTADGRVRNMGWASARARAFCLLSSVTCLLLLSGCITRGGRGPASTHVEPQPVRVPAQVIANFFFVESTQADGKKYRFMVDTGSSVSYVSAPPADALKRKEKH